MSVEKVENISHPNNPMFEKERQKHQEYTNGLEQQVREIAKRDPKKYLKYQGIGASHMNCSYNLTIGVDDEADVYNAQRLLYNIRDYYLEDQDLADAEKNLLVRVYGDKWRDIINELK